MLCFNAFGYIFLYYHASYQFKRIASEKIETIIPKDKLIKIEVSQEEQVNYINEDEIEVNGNMYDIYSKEITDNGMVFYCISDENESTLNTTFYQYVSNNINDFGKSLPKENKLKDGFDDFIEVINEVFVRTDNTEFSVISNVEMISQITLDKQTPPPKPLA